MMFEPLYCYLISHTECHKLPPICSMWVVNNDRIFLEPWRLIGYGFVHNNLGHLAANAVAQLFFGLPLELSNGSVNIAYVYLSGMFLAGLGHVMTSCRDVPLAGASGKNWKLYV